MALPAGTELASFEIVRLLGAGGMGEVYLARDRRLNRHVAVKVLPAEVTTDSHRLARFEQEARAASALSHPNICHIYHLGETLDHRRYVAREYVDGETLHDRLMATRLPLREALEIAVQIAAALTAAHAAGIVHRDIKPENVMIRRDRLVKVLDFGLAKLAPSATAFMSHGPTQTAGATDPGSVVGTLDYMSPEQARGLDVDARTDIWALGVVLYEMVAGRAPFTGATRSGVLVAILDREPAPLARVTPEVPAELQRIVGKALRKDPEQRYQVMKDLRLDLEALRDELGATDRSRAIAEGSTVVSIQKTTLPGATRRATRLRGWTIASAFVLLAGAAAVGVWQRSQQSNRASPRPVARYTQATFSGDVVAAALSPDGRTVAYASREQSRNPRVLVRRQAAAACSWGLTSFSDPSPSRPTPRISPAGRHPRGCSASRIQGG
jgi:serine/threonine protein kinase